MPFDGYAFNQVVNFNQFFDQQVLPYYKSSGVQGNFISPDGHRIVYTKFIHPDNKKVILLSPGRTEFSMKYAELVYDLKDLGFDIFILDHRGQGDSDRLVTDAQKGHVSRFRDYVEDFASFAEVVKTEKHYTRKILLAHCMGSIVGMSYAQTNPKYFDGIITTSPMLEINLKGLPEQMGLGIFSTLNFFGLGSDYLLGTGPNETNIPFEENRVTSCKLRYHAVRRIEGDRPHYVMGGPTNDWLYHSIMASKKVFEKRSEISVPVLMFQAEKDDFVSRDRQDQFIKDVKNGEKVLVKDSLHEILHEKDSIRNGVVKKIRQFLCQF